MIIHRFLEISLNASIVIYLISNRAYSFFRGLLSQIFYPIFTRTAPTFLEQSAPIQKKSIDVINRLDKEVQEEQIDLMTSIVVDKSYPSEKDKENKTPLHYACEIGNISIVQVLLKNISEEPDEDYIFPDLESALDQKTPLIDAQDDHGATALHYGCHP